MTQAAAVPSWCLGVILPLILAAFLHQGFATVASPTSAPHKDQKPDRGSYNVTNTNGTVCLLAYMGLQFHIAFPISPNKTIQDVKNLNPAQTKSSGTCEADHAVLQLMSDNINVTFGFTLNTTSKKYHLGEVTVSVYLPEVKEPILMTNNSLNYLRGTLGFSYMCKEEQKLTVVQSLSIKTFQVQIQPFSVSGDQFATAEECQLDEDDMLIPIIVGVALAGLVLIVLLAYLIGRKRSHAGYQTI